MSREHDSTYIEMCRKSEEIQVLWKKEYGDFVVVETDMGDKIKTVFDGVYNQYDSSPNHISPVYWNISNCVWLPRQDQLQHILISEKAQHLNGFRITLVELFYQFCCTVYIIPNTPLYIFDSIEQLWIAFVMHHKYQKKWCKNDWVNEAI